MPDITMCKGGDCPLKKSCYRFLAEVEKESDQTYFGAPPFALEEGNVVCKFYWKVEGSEEN